MDVMPKFIFFKQNGNNKYLHYRPSKGGSNSFLHFRDYAKNQKAELVAEPEKADQLDESEMADESHWHYLRFEVEKAKTVEGLVHIRTCYNNKYWVRKSEDNNTIVAEAHEPEEDLSKWSCTLFKPVFENKEESADELEKKISLLHAGQNFVGFTTSDTDEFHHLAINEAQKSSSVITMIDMESTPILPDCLTIVGSNGNYVNTVTQPQRVNFDASDVGVLGVAHIVHQTDNPPQIMIGVRSSPTLAWGPANIPPPVQSVPIKDSYPMNYQKLMCIPISVGNTIAIREAQHNTYLSRLASANCLDYRSTTITDDAIFKVGEPIRQRDITDATYDIKNARTYNLSSIDKYRDSRSNNSSVEQEGIFQVEYKVSQTMTWSQSTTINVGFTVSWSQGIPLVGEAGVEVSYERSETWEWGKEIVNENTVTFTQNLTIPPKKKLTLRVVASKASCDVPFTCKVHDVMTDGSTRDYTKVDCLFVGSNEFGFDTFIDEEDL